jgi:hypothetical protein
MPDTLERDLAARLRDVGDTVPDVLQPPPDLERRIARRRKRGTRVVGRAGLALAACLVAALGLVSLVGRASEKHRVGVAPEAAAVARLDGTLMLDSRGPWVVALDADGHQTETLVTAHRGMVVDAQLTADHRTLWYLSVAGTAGVDCGELVRADVESGASKIVGHAVAFGISRDGTRLAVAGRGTCAPSPGGTLAVRDLANETQSTAALPIVPNRISWSPLGDRIVANSSNTRVFVVPSRLGGPLESLDTPIGESATFGTDGLYVADGGLVERWNLALDRRSVIGETSPNIVQVVPTADRTYVLLRSRPGGPADTLMALGAINGPAVFVRTFASGFGALTPVAR